MITIAICDDNPQFARILALKLRELCAYKLPDRIKCEVVPTFSSANEVLHYLSNKSINILFLDIDMPKTNGFKLAEILNDRYPDTIIIFVSAYDNFVYSSFEYSPFRFLRKSHLEEELPSTFGKVIEKCVINSETILFHTTKGDTVLRYKDILYLESDRNYFSIHCTSNAIYRCRGSLSTVEEKAISHDFFRIHSAYIVNLEHIENIDETGYVRMKNNSKLNISRRKSTAFKEVYTQYIKRRFTK